MNLFNEPGQKVNDVYKTTNLEMFQQLKGNRHPNLKHIRRLSESIKANNFLQSPIIVNEKMEVIDGQNRLLAAKQVGTPIYYIVVNDYSLKEVQILNLNQKNWNKEDFIDGYADMGLSPYLKLRNFIRKNNEFNKTSCIYMCQNSKTNNLAASKFRSDHTVFNQKQVLEEGTWIGGDFSLAQKWVDKLKMIKQYYKGYNRAAFVNAMIGMFKNEVFDFDRFLHKLKTYPGMMKNVTNVEDYIDMIEKIYNKGARDQVSLKYKNH